MGATRPAGIKERLTDRHVISAVCESLFSSVWTFSLMPDAGRVAPIRGSDSYQIYRLKNKFEAM